MSKPDDIPQDVWLSAFEPAEYAYLAHAPETAQEIVARVILAERTRCSLIIDAEIEMGGDDREAQRKINFGEAPRYIPGWSPYDASKETDD